MNKKDEIFKNATTPYSKFTLMVVSFLGIGFAPFMPGTFGSFCAIPFAWLLLWLGGWKVLTLGAAIVLIAGFYFTSQALTIGTEKDPSYVVIDEVAGQFITFIVPAIFFPMYIQSIPFYAAGFLLFRLFDITKPLQVGWADEFIEGATGVMLDDVFAGLYASAVLSGSIFLYRMFFAVA